MTQKHNELSLRGLRELLGCQEFDNMADDLLIADIHCNGDFTLRSSPTRFDGYLAFFCHEGEFTIEINLTKVVVRQGVLVMCISGNFIRVAVPSKLNDAHITLIACTKPMMEGTTFDFNKLYEESMGIFENPCVELRDEEMTLCGKYLSLAKEICSFDLKYSRDALTTLFSSLFYLMGAMWTDRLSAAAKLPAQKANTARAKEMFRKFLKLVKENYITQKNVAFYADKLYVTSKYLSRIVKEVSGRSAAQWIDSFVILEAKSLLKCSGLSIKDVVYQLNFASQTTFYRFFKAQTGLTPVEYREL